VQAAGAGRAVRAALAGVKAVTLSAPGVLLDEWDPVELQVPPRRAPCLHFACMRSLMMRAAAHSPVRASLNLWHLRQ
jgi:hypothetical protein